MERHETRRRPGRRAIGLASVTAWLVLAAAPARADRDCTPGPGDAVVVPVSVSDELDVTLGDGRVLRLAGIDPARATAARPEGAVLARQALEAWLGAGPVLARGLAPAPDRWGREPVLLLRPGGSAAAALVGAGVARVRPEAGIGACWPGLVAGEGEARGAQRGLWADPAYAVLAPGDAEGLAAQAGGMALVEGILHLHAARGTLYLSLGRDRWGFAAIVSRRDAARFAKAGLDLADYEGTPVRLRGELDRRFGPRLRVTEPEAVESLEPGSIVEPPDVKHWTARARPR